MHLTRLPVHLIYVRWRPSRSRRDGVAPQIAGHPHIHSVRGVTEAELIDVAPTDRRTEMTEASGRRAS